MSRFPRQATERRIALRRTGAAALLMAALGLWAPAMAGEAGVLLTRHLEAGTLVEGEAALRPLAEAAPEDGEAQFALGTVMFLRAVEELGRDFHRHGLAAPTGFGAPLFRMPVPANSAPEPLTYEALRDILRRFVERVDAAEGRLARVGEGEFEVVVDLADIRLDLDHDGVAGDDERLVVLLAAADPTGIDGSAAPGLPSLVFAFDRADAIWLRGYSQVLAAFADFLLAHDFSDLFHATFHALFPGAGLPMQRFGEGNASFFTPDDARLADGIAFLHLIRWPVAEPERMARVRQRLLAVVAHSRENWRAILAETDDDREWLPSPRQSSPFPGLDVTEERVAAWLTLMDTAEAMLEGRVLVPHWRFSQGIDVKRVFEEPRAFDLLLWITGQAALPYLADGLMLGSEAGAVADIFQGRLLSYALWFN